MEENVVTNVVETPVVPEVVVETPAVQAIEPVQVQNIAVPAPAPEAKILGMDKRTLTDVGITTGLIMSGVALDRLIPWAWRKLKGAAQTMTSAISMAKNGVNLNEQAAAPQQANTTPANPDVQQPVNAAPVTPQENK